MNLTDCVNVLFENYKTEVFEKLEGVIPRWKGLATIAVPDDNANNVEGYVVLKDLNFQNGREGEVIIRGIYFYTFTHWVTQPKRRFSDWVMFRPVQAPEHHYRSSSLTSPFQRKISLVKSADVIPYYKNSD